MSKPDDIPQDIWDLAERLPIISENFDDGDLMIVARALMTAKAEAYEDAAKICDPIHTDGPMTDHEKHAFDLRDVLSQAIRSKANRRST